MLKSFKIKELKIGLYVNIARSWKTPPLLKNSFLLHSENKIKKLLESGITSVMVDSEKCRYKDKADDMKNKDYEGYRGVPAK